MGWALKTVLKWTVTWIKNKTEDLHKKITMGFVNHTTFLPTFHLKMKFTFIFMLARLLFDLGQLATFFIPCFPVSDYHMDVLTFL